MKKKLMTLIFILIMTLGFIVNVHAATPSANSLTLKVIERDIKDNIIFSYPVKSYRNRFRL